MHWHPYGFAVARLETVTSVGTVRLHIWPRGLRRSYPNHPPFHCHDWDLVSLVLAGPYRDEVATETAASSKGRPVWKVSSAATSDAFERAPGPALRVVSTVKRSVDAGGLHSIPAGTFHRSRISASQLCATLVLTSEELWSERMILGEPSARRGARRPVTEGELATIRRQLVDAVAPTT